MTQRKGGFRRKTRSKLRRNPKEKGKINLTKYFKEYKEGQKVVLQLNPSVHKGMFLPRFHGRIGTITTKKGSCYRVAIKDGNKDKTMIVHPIHMKES
jgi:large subunit ribosomal protein L21e